MANIWGDETIAVWVDGMNFKRLKYALLAIPIILVLGAFVVIAEICILLWRAIRMTWAVSVLFWEGLWDKEE